MARNNRDNDQRRTETTASGSRVEVEPNGDFTVTFTMTASPEALRNLDRALDDARRDS